MPSDDLIELMVERPAVGGRMIGRCDGRIVLVDGAIPGERIRATVERTNRDVLFARTVEVLEASPDRRQATRRRCGGQSFAHIAYDRQLQLKGAIVQDAFRRGARIILQDVPPVLPSPETGHRMRARLHVDGESVGFFEERSHRICDVSDSGQLLPQAEELVSELSAESAALAAAGVRSIELVEDLAGANRALHVAVNGSVTGAEEWLRGARLDVSGVSVGSRYGRAASEVVVGIPHVADRLELFLPSVRAVGVRLRRHPHAFFQANRFLVADLVSAVAELSDSGPLVDLYAGVGLFAICVAAAREEPVTAVERDPVSVRDLAANAVALDAEVAVIRVSVEAYLERTETLAGSVVVVDPPRTGLSREVLTRLTRCQPRRIVYVSCDVATQARDLRTLVACGYGLEQIRVFDMFPNTPHIETIVSLVPTSALAPHSP